MFLQNWTKFAQPLFLYFRFEQRELLNFEGANGAIFRILNCESFI